MSHRSFESINRLKWLVWLWPVAVSFVWTTYILIQTVSLILVSNFFFPQKCQNRSKQKKHTHTHTHKKTLLSCHRKIFRTFLYRSSVTVEFHIRALAPYILNIYNVCPPMNINVCWWNSVYITMYTQFAHSNEFVMRIEKKKNCREWIIAIIALACQSQMVVCDSI